LDKYSIFHPLKLMWHGLYSICYLVNENGGV